MMDELQDRINLLLLFLFTVLKTGDKIVITREDMLIAHANFLSEGGVTWSFDRMNQSYTIEKLEKLNPTSTTLQ